MTRELGKIGETAEGGNLNEAMREFDFMYNGWEFERDGGKSDIEFHVLSKKGMGDDPSNPRFGLWRLGSVGKRS